MDRLHTYEALCKDIFDAIAEWQAAKQKLIL